MAVCPTTSVVHVTTCLSTLQDATGAINEVSLPLMGFFISRTQTTEPSQFSKQHSCCLSLPVEKG